MSAYGCLCDPGLNVVLPTMIAFGFGVYLLFVCLIVVRFVFHVCWFYYCCYDLVGFVDWLLLVCLL